MTLAMKLDESKIEGIAIGRPEGSRQAKLEIAKKSFSIELAHT